MTDINPSKPSFVYVTFIASTPEKVWEALTDPDMTEKYWFGYRVSARGKASDPVTAVSPKGREVHRDVLLESVRPGGCRTAGTRSTRAWPASGPRASPSRSSRSRTRSGSPSCTTIFDEGSKVYESIKGGWPAVLSSLKSFLETGRKLDSSWSDEDKKRVAELEAEL